MTPIFAKAFQPLEVHFHPDDCDQRQEPATVLLCSPDYYEIKDVKNPYMVVGGGMVKEKAVQQWNDLRNVYLSLKKDNIVQDVMSIDGVEGCEDMVFAANQSFPWVMWNGEKIAVMSNMKHESRQTEVLYFEDYYKDLKYTIVNPQSRGVFEGMGDLIPHPGRKLLYGGYGFRTEASVYDEICRIVDAPIIKLELINELFYHLDTCFLPLNESEVAIVVEAFSAESLQLIRKMFEGVYEIPIQEAQEGFAANAHIIYNPNRKMTAAIIQKGNPVTLNIIQQSVQRVFEVNTSEFMKSGGSVFCMKMMVY